MRGKEYRYTAVFEPAEGGGYTVYFPALPGCITEGDTLEDARSAAAEALYAYLESLLADGQPLPDDVREKVVQEQVTVELAGA